MVHLYAFELASYLIVGLELDTSLFSPGWLVDLLSQSQRGQSLRRGGLSWTQRGKQDIPLTARKHASSNRVQ